MPKILLVEDLAVDRRLIHGVLEREPTFLVQSVDSQAAALEFLTQDCPDLVVTELTPRNPEGLKLVDGIRARFPHVPVVLITGQGSEIEATDALRNGAAGYVPRAQIGELLCDTIRHLLDLTSVDASYDRLIERATHTRFEFKLDNDLALVLPLLDLASRMIGGMGVCDATGCLQVAVALEHAVLNAIIHGNLEIDPAELSAHRDAIIGGDAFQHRLKAPPHSERHVLVTIEVSHKAVRLTVRDQGKGFNTKSMSNVNSSIPLSGRTGRGLFLIGTFMDEVQYNETGNQVIMIKRRASTQSESSEAIPSLKSITKISETAPVAVDVKAPFQDLGELKSKHSGNSIRLTKSRITIGRDASCDVAIKSHSISQHHCALYIFQGWWYVRDLHSTNGIRVNNVLTTQHLLRPGAILRIGSLEYEVKYEPFKIGADGIEPPEDTF